MPQIKINNIFSIEIKLGESILESILRSNFSQSYSCLNGRCNSCKIKIVHGKTSTLKEELGLSEDEKKNNYVLACSRTAKEDISIESDNFSEMPPIKSQIIPTSISKIKLLSEDILELSLKIPDRINFKFVPGQYVTVKYKSLERSYSILNFDVFDQTLEILCKKVPDGMSSSYLFGHVQLGDRLILKGPNGMMNMLSQKSQNLILLATGVGISPIKCILNSLGSKNFLSQKKIFLFWGNRTLKSFIYDFNDEMQIYDLKLYKCLSKKIDKKTENNYFGYVQDILIKEGIPLDDSIIYACGSEAMIKDAKKICINGGLDENLFYSDAFVQTGE